MTLNLDIISKTKTFLDIEQWNIENPQEKSE